MDSMDESCQWDFLLSPPWKALLWGVVLVKRSSNDIDTRHWPSQQQCHTGTCIIERRKLNDLNSVPFLIFYYYLISFSWKTNRCNDRKTDCGYVQFGFGQDMLARWHGAARGGRSRCCRDCATRRRAAAAGLRHSLAWLMPMDSCFVPIILVYYHRNIMPKRSANALSLNLLFSDKCQRWFTTTDACHSVSTIFAYFSY